MYKKTILPFLAWLMFSLLITAGANTAPIKEVATAGQEAQYVLSIKFTPSGEVEISEGAKATITLWGYSNEVADAGATEIGNYDFALSDWNSSHEIRFTQADLERTEPRAGELRYYITFNINLGSGAQACTRELAWDYDKLEFLSFGEDEQKNNSVEIPIKQISNTCEEAETTQADELMSQLRNLTYQNEFTDAGARLNDGAYRAPIVEGSASELVVQLVSAVVNENPSAPIVAAVILATDPGGSGTFYDLAVVVKQNGQLINIASTFLGDRVRVEQVTINNDLVTVEMISHAEEDPLCCPTLPVSKTFRLEGSSLVEVETEMHETLAWKLDTQEDEYGTPRTQIALVVEGQEFQIGEGIDIAEIDSSDWQTYQIPSTALIAAGGWWAGSGDYYYVVREGDKLKVMQGSAGEDMNPDEMYQYESIREISLRTTTTDDYVLSIKFTPSTEVEIGKGAKATITLWGYSNQVADARNTQIGDYDFALSDWNSTHEIRFTHADLERTEPRSGKEGELRYYITFNIDLGSGGSACACELAWDYDKLEFFSFGEDEQKNNSVEIPIK